ncbi:MAG: hypothetical protein R2693_12060 [Nocardioidaceae bacterium]
MLTAVNAMNAGGTLLTGGINNVTFQVVTDPADTGGTISQTTTSRWSRPFCARLCSSEPIQVLTAGNTVDVTNRAFSQSMTRVISPGTTTEIWMRKIVLTGGVVNVNPTKTVSLTLINEPAKDTPVTVTLGADQAPAAQHPVAGSGDHRGSGGSLARLLEHLRVHRPGRSGEACWRSLVRWMSTTGPSGFWAAPAATAALPSR